MLCSRCLLHFSCGIMTLWLAPIPPEEKYFVSEAGRLQRNVQTLGSNATEFSIKPHAFSWKLNYKGFYRHGLYGLTSMEFNGLTPMTSPNLMSQRSFEPSAFPSLIKHSASIIRATSVWKWNEIDVPCFNVQNDMFVCLINWNYALYNGNLKEYHKRQLYSRLQMDETQVCIQTDAFDVSATVVFAINRSGSMRE